MSHLWTAEDYILLEEVLEKMAEIKRHREQRKAVGRPLPPMTRDEFLAEVQKITKNYMSSKGLRRRLVEAKQEIERLKSKLMEES